MVVLIFITFRRLGTRLHFFGCHGNVVISVFYIGNTIRKLKIMRTEIQIIKLKVIKKKLCSTLGLGIVGPGERPCT